MKKSASHLMLVVAIGALSGCAPPEPVSPAPTVLPTLPFILGATDTPAPTPTLEAQLDDNGIPMLLVPAGPFVMGSSEADIAAALASCEQLSTECEQHGFDAEGPQHTVSLNSFYIDQYEATNAQFAIFLGERGNQIEGGVPWLDAGDEDAPLHIEGGVWQAAPGYDDHPVVEVTWYAAQAYCEWRGARLPTEAEWEKAARWDPITGESLLYPWGNQHPTLELANYSGAHGGTTPVGSYPLGVSPVGAYDMAGNVFEWTADWYGVDAYTIGPPSEGIQRALRGGSWGDFGFLLRAANRGRLAPSVAFNFVGFRCARTTSSRTGG